MQCIHKTRDMRQISFWASRHVWQARLLVACCYLLINVLGMLWAVVCLAQGYHPGQGYVLLPCALTLGSLFFYSRGARRHDRRFLRRRLCHAAFGTATLLFVIYSTAEILQPAKPCSPVYASVRRQPAVHISTQQHGLAALLGRIGRAYADLSNGKKAALITVAVLVTALCVAGWAFICLCLLCDGAAEALVYTLMLLGSALLIFIGVRIIQSLARGEPLNRKDRRKAGGMRLFRFR